MQNLLSIYTGHGSLVNSLLALQPKYYVFNLNCCTKMGLNYTLSFVMFIKSQLPFSLYL